MAHEKKAGYGLGTIIAVVLSWTTNHSVFWVIIHGLLGWFYIIYFVITGQSISGGM